MSGRSPMLAPETEIYAGGELGLFALCSSGGQGAWRGLLEQAEGRGLSGLISAHPSEHVDLALLGVRHLCLVAAGDDLEAAIQLAATGAFASMCLLSPVLPDDDNLARAVAKLRLPRLLLAGAGEGDIAAARRFEARSAGPVMMRFIPLPARGVGLVSDSAGLAAESICLFAARNTSGALRQRP